MSGDREHALEAGCTGYIEKPINPETFITQIEQYLTELVNEDEMKKILIVDDLPQNLYMLGSIAEIQWL